MPADLQLKPKYPQLVSNMRRWRNFCEQWRHCYLLLLAIFWLAWRFSEIALPTLERTRIMGGLHPVDVLMLMQMLKVLWLVPLVLAILYALSFAIRCLNTAEAIAGTALLSIAILALGLLLAMAVIGF